MLVGSDLTVRRGAITALDGVSLRLQAGQVSGVLGPNGAGKSTLLEALSGELKTARGQVMLHGRALEGWSDRERARCLAVLPQSSTLSFAFQVEDVVAMGRLPHCSGRQADARIVAAALQAADAQHLAGRSYLRLSGGERQRVHLARVLAQLWPGDEGSVLLLDEPTSMLDPAHQHSILQAVRRFRSPARRTRCCARRRCKPCSAWMCWSSGIRNEVTPWSSPVEEVCGAHHRFNDSGLAERL